MSDDICGCETAEGTPCQHPAGENGRCWIASHNPDGESGTTVGRPSTFTEERAEDAIDAAKDGMSEAGCARAAGIPVSTLHDWVNTGEYSVNGEDFSEAFARARAQGERQLVKGALFNDRDAERQMDGQHARFLLSTSFDYVKTEKKEVEMDAEHSGELSVNINREVVTSDADE